LPIARRKIVKSIAELRATSRRHRIVASIAASALALVSVGVASGVAQAAVTPVANPDLSAGCGSDIVLILDDSNSVWNTDSRQQAVADAAQAFADGFRNTNSTLGVVRFNTTASVVSASQDLVDGVYENLDGTYLAGPRPPGGASNGGPGAANVGQGATNWEAALDTANDLVPAGGTRPKLVVIITDGQPTVSSDSGNGGDFSTGALDDGITQANAIKGKGAHILAVGVGSAFDNSTFQDALTKISGTDVFPGNEWDNSLGLNEQGALDFSGANTTDAVLVASFTNLATEIAAITAAACAGSLTIVKQVETADGQLVTSGSLVNGWEFDATRPNSGYVWLAPASGDAGTRSSTTGEGGNNEGTAFFQWRVTGANGDVSVTEDVKDGYVLDSVECDGEPVDVVDGDSFDISVPKDAQVNCVVTNREVPIVDIALDKTILGSAPYSVDTQRTFRLAVTNQSDVDATGVVVEDTLPASFSGPYTFNPNAGVSEAGGLVTWNVGSLNAGQTKQLDITGTLSQVGTLTNWAQVTDQDQEDVDSVPDNCSLSQGNLVNAEDDCDKVTLEVTRDYSLDIDKVRVGTGAVTVGDQIQFDLKVTNEGPSTAAAGLVVTDTLPNGLLNVDAEGEGAGAGSWTCSGVPIAGPTSNSSFSCTYGATLAKDVTRIVRVTATVGNTLADAESLSNNACVKKGVNSTTNDDCDDERIDLTPKSDLITIKTAVEDTVVTGEQAEWTYTVKNLGPSKKSGPFTVTDALPNGLTNVVVTPGAGWNCPVTNIAGPTSSTTFQCTFTPGPGGLEVNASTTAIAVAGTTTQAPAQGSSAVIVNTACVADGYEEMDNTPNDDNDGNDCGFDDVTVLPKVDLKMNKVVDVESGATVGDALEFRFSVTNLGPSAATTIGFTDSFDAGLENLTIASATNWSCSLEGQVLDCDWTGGAVAAGLTTTFDVVVTATVGVSLADAESVSNTACVKADDLEGDENDCDTTTTELDPKFDLVIDKVQVEANPLPVGAEINYTLEVFNNGPSKAPTGFLVADNVPSELSVNTATGTDWDCSVEGNSVVCEWDGEDLPIGPAPLITVNATVNETALQADPVINTACVAPEGTRDIFGDRVAVVDEGEGEKLEECDSVTTEFPKGNLTLGKSNEPGADEPFEGFGGTITYTLTAAANGTLDQTNVVVKDTVPGLDGPLASLDTTLVDGSVQCIDDPVTRVEVDCNGTVDDEDITISGDDLTWLLGTVTAGTAKYVTFQVTIDVPTTEEIEALGSIEDTRFFVRNVGFASSDYTDGDIPSDEVENPVDIDRIAGQPDNDCISDTPLFSITGAGFYAGETVKMRVFQNDGTTVFSDEYVTGTADGDGSVNFTNVLWPGFSEDPETGAKTYPSLDLRPIFVQLYGSPTTELVEIAYPAAEEFCDAQLEIQKDNVPTAETVITEFGAEIEYTMTVNYPEGAAYNAENVQVTDILPGYDGTFPSPPFGAVTYVDGSAECAPFDDPVGICEGGFAGDFYDDASKTVQFNLGQMQPGTSRTVSFTVTVDTQFVDGPGTVEFDIANRATVTSSFTKPDSDDARNQVEVEPEAGIEIVKSAARAPGALNQEEDDFFDSVAGVRGEVTVFRFEVTNTGDAAVSDLVLSDALNFGPSLGDSVLDSLNEDDLTDCRVGNSGSPNDGSSQSFSIGEVIGDDSELVVGPGETVFLFCDLLIPADLADELLDLNRVFNISSIDGETVLGDVEADSNVAVIKVFPEAFDAFPIKNIVDEDGTNPRAFDTLGEPTDATLKTFRMTIDNVSDEPLDFTLYDYFENESLGLSQAEREAIFDTMRCIDYDDPAGDFPDGFPSPIFGSPLTEIYDQGPEETTFGPSSLGDGAGTYYARGYALGVIEPGDGFEIACQALLPAGEYQLVNTFRMVANPVEGEIEEGELVDFGVQRAALVNRAADAVVGEIDLTASAGVVLGEPTVDVEEPEEPAEPPVEEPEVEPEVLGTKLPQTGLLLPVGTMVALGLVLIGMGAFLGAASRRRREASGTA
jgi:uncharacterized repeat protein (TIGR01451 family)